MTEVKHIVYRGCMDTITGQGVLKAEKRTSSRSPKIKRNKESPGLC